jgi:hypothetical protein
VSSKARDGVITVNRSDVLDMLDELDYRQERINALEVKITRSQIARKAAAKRRKAERERNERNSRALMEAISGVGTMTLAATGGRP